MPISCASSREATPTPWGPAMKNAFDSTGPRELRGDDPQVLRALRHVDLADHLRRADVGQLARHRGDVIRLGRDGRILGVRERLAELLVTAVEVTDDGVDGNHGLALEREDHAEDSVGGWVLRPHVHGDALGAAVAHLEDLPGFDVHRGCYFIGECGAGLRMIDFISARQGADFPRKTCHSGSWSTLLLTAARSFRSSYAQRCTASLSCPASLRLSNVQRWTTWFSVPNSVDQKPSSLPYLSPRIFRPISEEFLRYWPCVPGWSV